MGEEQTSRGQDSSVDGQDGLPSSTSPRRSPSGPPLSTWSIDGRSYNLFTLSLTAADPKDEPAPISCLINPLLVPFLPSPLPSRQQPPKDPSFAILPTPNKGAGMFATRSIPAGELIVVEHPALILPSSKFPDAVYEALGAALPEKRRQEMVNMADCRGREECPTVVEGVVRTNALVLELDPEGRLGEEEREIYGGRVSCINRIQS
ncbi:hypothetical protein NLJ89_g12229 [Agrocybe chaxingu]|uniref:SET domain-containing protein n=1 Tax=Agrocybe chaxingu TaxID=84603 RepID=A0A9W8JM96_9AGAR|nr:hypothetical protein NLJ89_g12229 [Agrocybe chaxingu]